MRKQIMVNGNLFDRCNAFDPSTQYAQEAFQNDSTLSLTPFREHVARLCRFIDVVLEYQFPLQQLNHDGISVNWHSVSRMLYMACAITDLEADTTLIDQSESWIWCGEAFDYSEAESEVASKFTAGLVLFNFICSALEALSVLISQKPKETTALTNKLVRELKGLEDTMVSLPFFKETFMSTWGHCNSSYDMERDLSRISRYIQDGLHSLSARLACCIRNKFAHGKFFVPYPNDHGTLSKYDANKQPEICRFYSTGRLMLLIMQILIIKITEGKPFHFQTHPEVDFDPSIPLLDSKMYLMHIHLDPPKVPDGQVNLPMALFPLRSPIRTIFG